MRRMRRILLDVHEKYSIALIIRNVRISNTEPIKHP
jgi:hypothetical protein